MKREREVTIRGLITGIAGLMVITTSSTYVALRMGALPWPTIFVTVVSMAIIGRFKDSTLQEINVTHTLMSAGAMVAGGLAFTIPGLWMLDSHINIPHSQLFVLSITGAVLGTLFTMLNRRRFIETEQLPFPMGQAAYQTLIAGTSGGSAAIWLFVSLGLSALFTLLRDQFGLIPAVLTIFSGGSIYPLLSIWVSPMAAGIGAIIGPTLSLIWLGGALFAYLFLVPFGLDASWFTSMAHAELFRQNLGIGLMVGTGLGILVKMLLTAFKSNLKSDKARAGGEKRSRSWYLFFSLTLVLAVVALTVATEITLPQAVLTVAGIYLVTNLAATLTGQTGINPMEILGILVLLAIQVFYKPTMIGAFSIAAVVAIAAGLSGDMMNDLKSGYLVGTKPRSQYIAEGIGGVIGAIIAVVALLVLKRAYGTFGGELMPAPQAAAVSSMVKGIGHKGAFLAGAVIGLILYLLHIPAATLGLGIYLPINISLIMGLGALLLLGIRTLAGSKRQSLIEEKTALVASGFLGGEGIMGVILAIMAMFG